MDGVHDPLALAPLPGTSVRLATQPSGRYRFALCGFGAAALLAVGLMTAGLPLISMSVLAVSGVWSLVVGSAIEVPGWPRDAGRYRRVAPDDIESNEARATYRAILVALAEVEHALAEAPRLRTSMTAVVERCRAAVGLSGRIALLANPLQRYLDTHNTYRVRSELDRLRARADDTSDDAALGTLRHAAATRARQLELLEQIIAKRDQVCARLELVQAALETFAATIVKLHMLDDEQLVLAGESVADHLEGIGGDLEVLESALGPELAA